MGRRSICVHVIVWSTLLILIILGAIPKSNADPASEVRSVPAFARPIYNKPVPKLPKLLMKPVVEAEKEGNGGNPNLVTQTVYGFLDFVTTIGNTVMVFTPQTKKGLEIVRPTLVVERSVEVKPTLVVESVEKGGRQPKLIEVVEEIDGTPVIESSEYEPQVFASAVNPVTTALEKSGKKSTASTIESRASIIEAVESKPEIQTINSSEEETIEEAARPTKILVQIGEPKSRDGTVAIVNAVVESTTSVLSKFVVTATKAPAQITAIPAPLPPPKESEPEIQTEQSVVSSSNSELNSEEARKDEEGDDETEGKGIVDVDPSPTASEDQTLYVLPQKEKKAEIYISPIASPNAYSRQPQLYVDVSPAKSFDVIVTATPTRKQFRQQNRNDYVSRFSQRNRPSSSTESNELGESKQNSFEPVAEDNSRRSSGRFRSRRPSSKQSNEDTATTSVYSSVISATPTRRFNSGGARTRSVGKSSSDSPTSFKSRSFGSSVKQYIQPTTSTSIYRFKLNRPTGRWRYKPSPKPKVNIIKTEEEELLAAPQTQILGNEKREIPQSPVYYNSYPESSPGEIQTLEESRTESNELVNDAEPELLPQTLRVSTVTPTEFSDLEKFLEIATIRSPYVFQAGNVKNTRYITLTKTFTKDHIKPTSASHLEASLENILATKAPYERILEGSNDVATLPVISLGGDMSTPPLETVTQTFSTTQLMLKTSILPVLYEGETTMYTLTQSYFITRLVTAHKTIPPFDLYQFVPTKSLREFNTALQEAGSEHREQLLSSEADTDENEANYQHILAPPDELTSVGSDFDPSTMDEKPFVVSKGAKKVEEVKEKESSVNANLVGLTPEQISFIQYFKANSNVPTPGAGFFPPPNLLQNQPLFEVTSHPVVINTVTTIVESKTLRILFGAKPTQTTLFSTRVVPTKVTTYVTTSVPVKSTAAIPSFFNAGPYGYLG